MLIIVGNKNDLGEDKRKVTLKEGEEYAKKNSFLFMEVSAKENTNIKALFFKSVIELPFFSQYKVDKDPQNYKLLEELEYENMDFNSGSLSNVVGDSSRINISMMKNSTSSNKKCKC